MLIDDEFKIVEKIGTTQENDSLLEICALDNYHEKCSFFKFFEVNFDVFSAGMNLQENNLAIKSISNIFSLLENTYIVEDNYMLSYVTSMLFYCDKDKNFLNLLLLTDGSLGIKLDFENIPSPRAVVVFILLSEMFKLESERIPSLLLVFAVILAP